MIWNSCSKFLRNSITFVNDLLHINLCSQRKDMVYFFMRALRQVPLLRMCMGG